MDYIIVERYDHYELCVEVEKLMLDGWKPQGGVAFYRSESNRDVKNRLVIAQAMVRKEYDFGGGT